MSKLKSAVRRVLAKLHLSGPRAAVLWVLTKLHLNTPTRIVLVLSPVFVSAAGLIVVYAAKWGLPVHLNAVELVGLFATGATLLSSKLLVWLHGEQRKAAAKADVPTKAVEGYRYPSSTLPPHRQGRLLGARGPDDLPPAAHAADDVHEIGAPE